MINKDKKEEIKERAKKELDRKIDEYIEQMDKESNGETFPITKIEKMWGDLIEDTKTIIHDLTQEAVDEIDEQYEINKKKQNTKKKE